jgi:hypothetical protein
MYQIWVSVGAALGNMDRFGWTVYRTCCAVHCVGTKNPPLRQFRATCGARPVFVSPARPMSGCLSAQVFGTCPCWTNRRWSTAERTRQHAKTDPVNLARSMMIPP